MVSEARELVWARNAILHGGWRGGDCRIPGGGGPPGPGLIMGPVLGPGNPLLDGPFIP
jgi:hypothetical protein